jgi:hypothetical protein
MSHTLTALLPSHSQFPRRRFEIRGLLYHNRFEDKLLSQYLAASESLQSLVMTFLDAATAPSQWNCRTKSEAGD